MFGWAEAVFPAHTVFKSPHLLQPSSIFPSAWTRPGLGTSTEVSCTGLLTQIDVDSLEAQGPGKAREVEEMTNEKGGIMTDLPSSCQEAPNPEWN